MIMSRTDFPDGFGAENISGIGNAGAGQLMDRLRREFAVQTHQIGFFHFVARMRQTGYQISVVGKQNESFAVFVQPSGGNQTDLFRLRDEIDRFFSRMPVVQGADIASRFVQHDADFFGRGLNDPALIFHPVTGHDPHSPALSGPAVDCDLS